MHMYFLPEPWKHSTELTQLYFFHFLIWYTSYQHLPDEWERTEGKGTLGCPLLPFASVLFAAEVVGSSRELTQERKAIDFPGDPVVKNLPANAGNSVLIPGLGRFHMLQGS